MKIFNLYCNILCNTEAALSLSYLLVLQRRFIMTNYPVCTEVKIHASYFLLSVTAAQLRTD